MSDDEYLGWIDSKIIEVNELLEAHKDNYEWQNEGLLEYWGAVLSTYKECRAEYIKGLQS